VKSAAEMCRVCCLFKIRLQNFQKRKTRENSQKGNCRSWEYSLRSKIFQLPGVLTQISDFLGTKAKPE
jgi:hypothetical protein